jgi:hypothetical protein
VRATERKRMETAVAPQNVGQDIDMTRAVARMPGLEIEIVHRRPSDDVEQISINLQATPSFEAFGRWFQTANPFVFWVQAAQMAWQPWLEFARTVTPRPQAPAAAPPRLRLLGAAAKDGDA